MKMWDVYLFSIINYNLVFFILHKTCVYLYERQCNIKGRAEWTWIWKLPPPLAYVIICHEMPSLNFVIWKTGERSLPYGVVGSDNIHKVLSMVSASGAQKCSQLPLIPYREQLYHLKSLWAREQALSSVKGTTFKRCQINQGLSNPMPKRNRSWV